MPTGSASRRRATKASVSADSLVHPLGVVDDAQQRPLLGDLGEQAQRREADEEPVRRVARALAEHDLERLALRSRKLRQPIEHRHAQLVQAGEGELHLRLDACRAQDGHRRCGRDQVLQQRGLADSGFTAQHQRPALAALDRGDEAVELHALPGSPSQRLAQP